MIIQQFVKEMNSFDINYYFYMDKNNELYLFLTDLPKDVYNKILFKRYAEYKSTKVEKIDRRYESSSLVKTGDRYDSFTEKEFKYFIKYIFKYVEVARDISRDGKKHLAIHLDQKYYLKKLCTISHIIREHFFNNDNISYTGY